MPERDSRDDPLTGRSRASRADDSAQRRGDPRADGVRADRLLRRQHAEQILRAAIDAAEPAALVERALAGATELAGDEPVRIIAIGKAAPTMARTARTVLGDRVSEAVVVAPPGTAAEPGVITGAHPLPDDSSVAAGRAVLQALQRSGDGARLLVLLSGGGSAIAALPLDGIHVREYADCVDRLMRSGADIVEVNTVRKHIDQLKGGRMAVLAGGAHCLGLVLSDVVGDPLDVIASGPLSPDPSTGADALEVLRHRQVIDRCAPAIIRALENGAETPRRGDPAFRNVRVRVVGGNDVAVNGASARAAELGYTVHRAPLPVTGLAHIAGETLAREAQQLQQAETGRLCIVAGGETTVAVRGGGRGGRNQELVLAACIALDHAPGITIASAGTDGIDGASDAAGAVADELTLDSATAAGVDPRRALDQNDSYTFFERAGGLLVTGPTGTNVNDVQVALVTGGPPTIIRADRRSTPDRPRP